MDRDRLQTPQHILPVDAQTQRKHRDPRPTNSLPNTSPAPFRRKRTFKEYEDPAPMAPAGSTDVVPIAIHKILIQEELDRLQLVVAGGHVLDLALAQDEQHLELEDCADSGSVSDPYLQTYNEFVITGRKPLPAVLHERLEVAKQASPETKIASGVLSDIKRCWFSIGRTLFLWDYEQNTPLFEYSDLRDTVIAVAVVPKNRELFTHKVTHMLLVSTPSEVLVFGVVFDPFFNLLSTGLSVTSNDSQYTQFCSHPNGRIFMGGSEGKVVELKYDYQYFFSTAKRYKRHICGPSLSTRLWSWFVTIEVGELACDPSRNLLYALITCSTVYSPFQIDVYDLGADGDGMSLALSIDAWSFLERLRSSNTALLTVPPDRLQLRRIFAVQRSVSLDYHLLVVLRNGTRVWVSLMVDSKQQAESSDPALSFRPTGDYAITVKLPPISIDTQSNSYIHASTAPVTVGFTSDKPSDYDQMLFLEDATLVMLEHTVSEMRLVAIRRSMARIAHLQTDEEEHVPEPCETVTCVEDFRQTFVQSMASVPATNLFDPSEAELCGFIPRSAFAALPTIHWINEDVFSVRCIPGLANACYMPPTQFQIITSREWLEFTELRPVDVLFNVLEDEGQRETDKIRSLCDKYGLAHVCTLLLSIALSPARFVRRAIPSLAVLEASSDRLRAKAQSLFTRLINCKVERDRPLMGVQVPKALSAEEPLLALVDHQALALYLSRALRPIWAETIAYQDIETRSLVENFRKPHLDAVKSRLEAFVSFMESQYPDSLTSFQRSNVLLPADRVLPRNPLSQIYALATRSLQALHLVLQVSEDFAFRRMAVEMRMEEQEGLRTATFKDLIATQHGHLLAKGIIEAYIRQMKTARVRTKRIKLEEVLALFSQKCVGFFTPADAEVFLGEDAISRAQMEPDPALRQDFLTAAIQRFMKNAASVPIRRVCESLLLAREVMPVISLCIKKAKDLSEIIGTAAMKDMQECYEMIFLVLEDVHQSLAVRNTFFVPYLSGRDLDGIARLENDIIVECCKVPHKELHWALMQWLTRMNQLHKIVQLESPHVLEFISAQFDVDERMAVPLLAEYNMKMKDFKRAYIEYGRLANLSQDNALTRELIPLKTRCEYLDLSLVCLETYMKDLRSDDAAFKKLEEERISLDRSQRLCQIQLRVQRDLLAKVDPRGSQSWSTDAEDLDRRLLTMQELYEQVARPKQLYDAQLALLDFHRECSTTPTPDAVAEMKSLYVPIIESLRSVQWPEAVIKKLEEIGKKYPYSFPVNIVISHCEAINLDEGLEQPWVVTTILGLPIVCDFVQLFDVYEHIWKDSGNGDLKRVWMICIRIEQLLEIWADVAEKKTSSLPAFCEIQFSGKCHVDSLVSVIRRVTDLLDSLKSRSTLFDNDRKGQITASAEILHQRFISLEDRLHYKSQSRSNPQQPDSDSQSLPRIPKKLLAIPLDRL